MRKPKIYPSGRTDVDIRSIKNFKKRAEKWKKRIHDDTEYYYNILRQYVQKHEPVRLIDDSFSDDAPPKVTYESAHGNETVVADKIGVDESGKYRVHIIEWNGRKKDVWAPEMIFPVNQVRLFLPYLEWPTE